LYQSTLDYLYSRLPMFTRIGAAAYKADLNNTIALCGALGNPQNSFKTIHIAGTNGKGSVSHFMSSILQEAGYKTGLYTSPHLLDFRERIKINGEMVSEDFVVQFIEKIKPLIEEIEPSFFEVTVAMAFEYFAEQKVDIAVIETGLGGRLDSTNIINPILSIITNISYDHQNLLGNSLQEIAGEKAGIIKEKTPVVIGKTQLEIKQVFDNKAKEKGAEIYYADEYYSPLSIKYKDGFIEAEYTDKQNNKTIHLKSALAGKYQEENIITVMKSSEILNTEGLLTLPKYSPKETTFAPLSFGEGPGVRLTDSIIHFGIENVLKNTGFMGRWQILQNNPLVVCDIAHNEAGLMVVFEQALSLKYSTLHIVFGMVKDKDISKAISLLPKNATYYFCQPGLPRALDVNSLYFLAKEAGVQGSAYETVVKAMEAALKKASPDDFILITGSAFVVAEALEAWQEKHS